MDKIAFVFPGQGAQTPGMGKDLIERVLFSRAIMIQADQIRPGTSEQCFHGDEATLAQTAVTQPCLYAVEVAASVGLLSSGVEPDMVAGFSLGELAALQTCGAVDFATGFEMVIERGKLMQAASEQSSTAMIAVMMLDSAKVERLCSEYDDVFPVNYNGPDQIVVAGKQDHLDRLVQPIKALGGRIMPLKVSGGFHTPYMAEAAKQFGAYLQNVTVNPPKVPIYSNFTARPYPNEPQEKQKELLQQQICHPVQWQKLVENMISAGADTFIEVGPGRVLRGLIRRIDKGVRIFNVSDWESLDNTVKAIEGARRYAR